MAGMKLLQSGESAEKNFFAGDREADYLVFLSSRVKCRTCFATSPHSSAIQYSLLLPPTAGCERRQIHKVKVECRARRGPLSIVDQKGKETEII